MAAFTVIATNDVGASGVNEIQFTGIAGTYDHLYITASLRTDGVDSAKWDDVAMRFNSVATSSEYSSTLIECSNTSPVAGQITSNGARVMRATNSDADANLFNPLEIWIPNYAGSVGFQPFIAKNSVIGDLAATTYWRMFVTAGLWSGTPAAITQVDLHLNHGTDLFVEHSTATLYGVTGA